MKKACIFFAAVLFFIQTALAFTIIIPVSKSIAVPSSTSLSFGPFGGQKDDGSPGDYVCKDW
jgi:hypothetical protein